MTKLNLTALAAKTRKVAPKFAIAALAATAASVVVTALVKESDPESEAEVVETDEA